MIRGDRRRLALPCALGIGLLADWLLRAPGEPALNVALLATAGTVSVLLLRGPRALRGWNGALLGMALIFSFALVGRDADMLRGFNLLAAMGSALLAAGAGSWLARAGVSEYVRAGVISAFALVTGPAPLVSGAARPAGRPRYRHVFAVVRGAAIALPLLLLFGGLLAAADPVFDRLVGTAFAFDPGELFGHAAVIGVISWFSAGYLARWIAPPPVAVPLNLPHVRVGMVEGAIVLGLLNALFLAFVLVQLRYLFGGAGLVQATAGLSYAEYARRGFFEIVTVAALMVPLLLLAEWCVRRERATEQWIFRGLAYGQLVLLFAILGSALYRMILYRATYGLTEQRLLTTWFMGWIAFVLVWLAVTVLHDRRRHFAIGALGSALAVLLLLNVANPYATIARVNAERSAAGARYDVEHAAALPADAVPTLLASLDALPSASRCALARSLSERWQTADQDWRTFNVSEWRARSTVQSAHARLNAMCRVAAG